MASDLARESRITLEAGDSRLQRLVVKSWRQTIVESSPDSCIGGADTKTPLLGAEEMAHWVNCLLCKHGARSLPSTEKPRKAALCNLSARMQKQGMDEPC